MVLLMEENKMLGERLRSLRGKRTQEEVSKALGLSRARYSHYENNRVEPDTEILNKMADFFNVSTDYLLGRTDKKISTWDSKLPELTAKDERDIAKRMEKLKEDLTSAEGLSFHGEPLSEEAVESLLEAIEYAERQTTRINKKYIPKKYRKDNK